MHKPDAKRLHDPLSGPKLIAEASSIVGTRKALALRVGLSDEALRLISKGTHDIKYPLQYMLETILNET